MSEIIPTVQELQSQVESLQIDNAFLSFSQGFNVLGSDKALEFVPYVNKPVRQHREYEALFELSNYAANIVEYLPDSMGQVHPTYTCDIPEATAWIQEKISSVIPLFVEASKIARFTGGAGILIGAADGETDLSQPLNTSRLLRLEFFSVIEGGVNGILQIQQIEKDPRSPNYNKPLFYKARNTSQSIHHSRIIPFYGAKCLSRDLRHKYKYWGMPVLERPLSSIRQLDMADQSIAQTLTTFRMLIAEIPDLDLKLESDEGRESLKKYLALLTFALNTRNVLPMAGASSDGRTQPSKLYNLKTDYSGLDIVLRHIKEQLAGQSDIPYGMLFNSGSKGSGLGSSSSSGSTSSDRTEERKWAEYVHRRHESDWREPLEYLIRLWHLSVEGKSARQLPSIHKLEFPSILQMSEGEKVSIDKTRSEEYKNLIDSQIIKPEEAAIALSKGTSIAATIDLESRQRSPQNGASLTNDDATPAQRILDWYGFEIGLQYFPFQKRHGRTLTAGYGHLRRTRGADGMALDCYVGPNLDSDKIYAVEQLINGKFDEEKIILGCQSKEEARSLYLANMPIEMFGGIRELTMRQLEQYRVNEDVQADSQ